MKRLFASAAVVFLLSLIASLSVSACRVESSGPPKPTGTPMVVSATPPFAPASAIVTPSPEPASASPEPEPTATTASTQPPAPPRDLSLTQNAGELQVTLLVSPNRAGYNEISLYFFDPAGLWITVQTVAIRITFLDVKSSTIVETVSPLHPGHAFMTGDHLRHGGRWQIEAAFQGPGLDGAMTTFELAVR